MNKLLIFTITLLLSGCSTEHAERSFTLTTSNQCQHIWHISHAHSLMSRFNPPQGWPLKQASISNHHFDHIQQYHRQHNAGWSVAPEQTLALKTGYAITPQDMKWNSLTLQFEVNGQYTNIKHWVSQFAAGKNCHITLLPSCHEWVFDC